MAFFERSVRALLGGLAIVACKSAAAPSDIKTSSVLVADASAPVLVVEPPKDDASSAVEAPLFPPLRNVDWKNHDYGGFAGKLRDGHAESHIYGPNGGPHDTFETTFITVAYGDLDGDRREEAVVVLRESTWIAATSRERTDCTLYVFAWREEKPEVAASMNFLSATTDVRVAAGKVVVEERDARGTCVRELTLEGDHVVPTTPRCHP